MNLKIIWLPICFITEVIYSARYGIPVSGHDYIEQDNGELKCDMCGKVSKCR